MTAPHVRHIVDSIESSVAFHTDHFGFRLAARSDPNFALFEPAADSKQR